MDSFDLEDLQKGVQEYKNDLINKLERVYHRSKELRNNSDLLTIVLDYSPRDLDTGKRLGKKRKKLKFISYAILLYYTTYSY